ncbi:MAG: ferredoxin domain-containing protein, partial [Ignisphaera sp.]
RDWKLDANTVCSIVNLGIALGSAAKLASILNVDNRIMFTIGVAAQEMKLIDADYTFGIPLSATSKNIYFDRIWQAKK